MIKEISCAPVSRRESRRLDRREIILNVAAQSFLEQGYASTTMSSIAAALGGSKGTLWSHFPSKEALFEAVIDRATAAYRAKLSEILDTRGDFSTTLKRVCAGIMEKILSPEAVSLYRLVVAEAGRFPEMGRIFYNRGPRRTWELLAEFLSSAMNDGIIRRADPLDAARFLVSLCMADCHQQLLMGMIQSAPPEAVERDIDRAIAVFMNTFAADAARLDG
ncbi:AcrR family transcriptional regulator [Sphingobium boeckii]|uniref:AcrR family transcriptional regulator n=2 Tax=Sphingobium boeckii TaxID=1082345 RepID=A0A7W9EDZ4_9SPHN|nr:AcrR family transcriptional regulator [Sphingobium boeckii]